MDDAKRNCDCNEPDDCTSCNDQQNLEEFWMNRLVKQIDEGKAPQWVKDALAANKVPRTVILVAYLQWERERANAMVYA